MEGDEEVETSDVTVDYVPTGARRRGGLFFSEFRPMGYNRP